MLSLLIAVGCLGGALAVLTFWTIAGGVSLWREARTWCCDLFCDEQPIVHQVSVSSIDDETALRIRAEVDRMRARALLQNVEPVDPVVAQQIHEAMRRTTVVPFRAVGKSERTMKIEVH